MRSTKKLLSMVLTLVMVLGLLSGCDRADVSDTSPATTDNSGTTATAVPSESSEPEEITEATEPTEPAETTEATEPTEPVENTEPTDVPLTTEVDEAHYDSGYIEKFTKYYNQQGELVKSERYKHYPVGDIEIRTEYYNQQGELVKYEGNYIYQSGGESYSIEFYDELGVPYFYEGTYHENGKPISTWVYDLQAGILTREEFAYHENGTLSHYDISHWGCYLDSKTDYLEAGDLLDVYSEEYDNSGAVIDTDYSVHDPETGLWTFEDYEDTQKYGAEIIGYSDGIFTDIYRQPAHLVVGIYHGVYAETGNVWADAQRNMDGSGKIYYYYPDGSPEQLTDWTFDETTNTWTMEQYHYPEPADDFAYHTVYRVQYDDNGNIILLHHDSDGYVTEYQLHYNEQGVLEDSEYRVQYDDDGNIIRLYHISNGFETGYEFQYNALRILEYIIPIL